MTVAAAPPRLPVYRARLRNGLQVVVSPIEALGFAAVNTWHAVGSLDDGPGRSGLAHLSEHVCFDESGGRVLAQANATTSFERTNFVDVGSPDAVPAMLRAVRMRVERAPESAREVDRHRNVVIQEIREREDGVAFGSGLRRSLRLLFGDGHPFGRPALGEIDEVARLSAGDVTRFVGQTYVAARTVVCVVGSVDPDEVFARAENELSALPAGMPAPAAPLPAAAAQRGSGAGRAAREDVQEEQAAGMLRFAWAAPAAAEPGCAAMEVLLAALAGAPWTVFGAAFAAEHGLLGASADHVRCLAGPSIGVLRLAVCPGVELDAAECAVRNELARLSEHGVDDALAAAALARCRKQRLALLSSARSRAEELCRVHSWYGDDPFGGTDIDLDPYVGCGQTALRAAAAAVDPVLVAFHPAPDDEPGWIL